MNTRFPAPLRAHVPSGHPSGRRQATPSPLSHPTRLRFLTGSLVLLTAGCLFMGAARAATGSEDSAVNSQIADVGSTGVGLLMGAAEANPLGLVTLGMKAAAYQQIKEAPPVEQPRLWGMYGAFGWGAAANNLCIIGTIASGGALAALCPVLGVATGVGMWNSNQAERDRETFDAICHEAQARNPEMVCTYNEPSI